MIEFIWYPSRAHCKSRGPNPVLIPKFYTFIQVRLQNIFEAELKQELVFIAAIEVSFISKVPKEFYPELSPRTQTSTYINDIKFVLKSFCVLL